MRANKPKYSVGDLIPIKTAMGNIVYCELLDDHYCISPTTGDYTFLLDDKAILLQLDEFTFRKNNHFDSLGLNTGLERSGKSMFVFQKKKIFESPLYQDKARLNDLLTTDNWSLDTFARDFHINIDEITFTIDDYRAQLALAIEGSGKIVDLDEAGYGLSSLSWWESEQRQLYIQFQIIGKKKIISELVLPHKDDLNNRFRDRRVAFWSHISTRRQEKKMERGFVEVRRGQPDKWKLDTYWEPWITFKFADWSNDEDWQKYEIKKDAFIKMVAEETKEQDSFKDLGIRDSKYLRETMLLINEMRNPTGNYASNLKYTEKDIAVITGVKQNTLSERISRYWEKQELMAEREMQRKKKAETNV